MRGNPPTKKGAEDSDENDEIEKESQKRCIHKIPRSIMLFLGCVFYFWVAIQLYVLFFYKDNQSNYYHHNAPVFDSHHLEYKMRDFGIGHPYPRVFDVPLDAMEDNNDDTLMEFLHDWQDFIKELFHQLFFTNAPGIAGIQLYKPDDEKVYYDPVPNVIILNRLIEGNKSLSYRVIDAFVLGSQAKDNLLATVKKNTIRTDEFVILLNPRKVAGSEHKSLSVSSTSIFSDRPIKREFYPTIMASGIAVEIYNGVRVMDKVELVLRGDESFFFQQYMMDLKQLKNIQRIDLY
jgi:hypothetical protein